MRRIPFLDTARSLCMLWIVGIWHMVAYLSNKFEVQNSYTNYITIGVLATFTFLSGFFLGGGIESLEGVARFYKKRVKRFLLLFLISCVSLYVIHLVVNSVNFIVSFKQLVCTVTGLACFIAPMPLTIWYFSMMIFFYIITPAITMQKRLKNKVIVCLLIYGILIITNLFWETDSRVVLYFPIYSSALMLSGKIDLKKIEKFNFPILFIFLFVCIFSIFLSEFCGGNYFIQLLPAITCGIVILEISKLLTVSKTENIFYKISYVSMCAYLFHRQFFGAVELVFGEFSLVLAYCVFLPLFLVVCYYTQKIYDYIINKIML